MQKYVHKGLYPFWYKAKGYFINLKALPANSGEHCPENFKTKWQQTLQRPPLQEVNFQIVPPFLFILEQLFRTDSPKNDRQGVTRKRKAPLT